jgi:hypothetical protein
MADAILGLKVQRGKAQWLLVGGLAALLVGVILFSEEDAPAAPESTAGNTSESSAAGRRRAAAPQPAKRNAPRWAKAAVPALEEAIAEDPFAMSPELSQALGLQTAASASAPPAQNARPDGEREHASRTVAQWRSLGVSMIVTTPTGMAALVGNQLLREGQVIDGVRVVTIDRHGIVVEPVAGPGDQVN